MESQGIFSEIFFVFLEKKNEALFYNGGSDPNMRNAIYTESIIPSDLILKYKKYNLNNNEDNCNK